MNYWASLVRLVMDSRCCIMGSWHRSQWFFFSPDTPAWDQGLSCVTLFDFICTGQNQVRWPQVPALGREGVPGLTKFTPC